MRRLAWIPVLLFGAAVALVGCQGGSSTAPAFNTGVPAPTFPPVPAFAVATTEPFPAPVNGVSGVQLPSAAGFGGSIGFPFTSVPAGATLTATFSSTAPNGVNPLAFRRVLSAGPPHVTVLYLCITSSVNLTTNGLPTFSFTAPPPFLAADVQWFLEQLVAGSWYAYAGPSEPSGGSVSFTGPTPLTFKAGVPDCFGLIVELPGEPPPPTAPPTAVPTATPPGQTPSPTPTPTAVPTATPPGQTPTPTPTPSPNVTPTATPTAAPTATPTATPHPTATPSPTPHPTATPVHTPSPSPTPVHTPTPTPHPTATPVHTPSPSPTPVHTATPTPHPTATPVHTPTPTPHPTATPVHTPSPSPTPVHTATPTPHPTATPTRTPSPTPSPTATPHVTPSPSPTPVPGVLTAGPNPTDVFGLGASFSKPISVTETGYGGNFGEQDTCSGVATVTTANAHGPTSTYTVTGVAAGSCAATFADTNSQNVNVNIVVTTNGVIINGARW